MPWTFMLSLIFGCIAIAFLLYSKSYKTTRQYGGREGVDSQPDSERVANKRLFRNIGIGIAIFATLLLIFASVKIVSTKNVGIETSFGATTGELSNGLHLTPPWYKVTEMDAAIQTDSYTGDNCLDVRIANQQTACVSISIRWRIQPHSAPELFRDFRSFNHVRDSLVTRELTAAINNQLANYNPLNSVLGGVLPEGQQPNPALSVIATKVTEQMRAEIGSQIEIINTIIPIVKFDSGTQDRINQLQQQIAATRVAQQAKITAIAQAEANNALAASVAKSPNVLVAQCLDTLETMVKNKQPVPAGFSCWPGNGLAGIIAPSK